MTQARKHLALAIKAAADWTEYVTRVEAQLAAKESAYLKAGGAERQQAEEAVKTARMANAAPEMQALHSVLGRADTTGPTVAQPRRR